MGGSQKLFFTAVLSPLALGCAIVTAYWLSILWRGAWKYRELMLPVFVLAAVTSPLVVVIAVIHSGRHGMRAVVMWTAVLMAGCAAVAGGVFFAVLDNCRLSCGTRIRAVFQSPSGRQKAIWAVETCHSAARYCPAISHVLVGSVKDSAAKNALSIEADDEVTLHWESDNVLRIDAPGPARVLSHTDTVGAVRIVYRPVGFL
jgi:hypothetical protein